AREAEVVLKEALKRGGPDDKELYAIHVLLARAYQDRGAMAEMVGELEAARAVPGLDGAEQGGILFNLGSTYAVLHPPRKMEAIETLKGFATRACRGSRAQLFKAQCETTDALLRQLWGTAP